MGANVGSSSRVLNNISVLARGCVASASQEPRNVTRALYEGIAKIPSEAKYKGGKVYVKGLKAP